jgi:hypothetical protein
MYCDTFFGYYKFWIATPQAVRNDEVIALLMV